MASFTLGPDPRFHVGATLYCYRGTGLVPASPTVVDTAVVAADSTTTFEDLDRGTSYLAGLSVNGPFVSFRVEAAGGTDTAVIKYTAVFSQAEAAVGRSGTFRVPAVAAVALVTLSCVGAPDGDDLAVDLVVNGDVVTSLSIGDGETGDVTDTPDVDLDAGDQIWAEVNSVGDPAATHIVLQVDLV